MPLGLSFTDQSRHVDGHPQHVHEPTPQAHLAWADRGRQIGDSSRTSALGAGRPRFRWRAGRFAPQRSSCPLLQFRHEMVISERISGTSRRPNLICCVRSAGQRLAPIVRGTNFAPAPEINCSRWVPSLGMGPRARPRVLFGSSDQSGANRVQVHVQQRPNQVSPA